MQKFILGPLRLALVIGLLSIAAVPASQAAQAGIEPAHSALWFNPDRDGEGWVLEVLDHTRAVLYWFGYDESGAQRWLTGIGHIGGGQIDFPELLAAGQGGLLDVGSLQVNFNDCDHGRLDYQVFGQAGGVDIQRLSQTIGQGCGGTDGDAWRASAALSGSWYDTDHDGEGFAFQVLESGQAVMTWFGFDGQGHPLWAIGVGELTAPGTFLVPLQTTQGGGFGADFDPESVERIDWVTASLQLDCTNGNLVLGDETLSLTRLTTLSDGDCPLSLSSTAPIDQARWDRRFAVRGLAGSDLLAATIRDMAVADDGRLLVAGDFSWAGSRAVPPLVMGNVTDQSWQPYPALNDVPSTAVTALASAPGQPLAMAVNLGNRGRILLDDGSGTQEIGEYFSSVHRLAWHEGQLWAAGSFRFVGNEEFTHLAVWDGVEWQAPPGGEPDEMVWALLSTDDGLYIAGGFEQIGEQPVTGVARWDGASWQNYDLPGTVYALSMHEQVLVAAGALGPEAPGEGVVRRVGDGWEPLGGGLHADGSSRAIVSDIAVFEGDLYAAGCFDTGNAPPDEPAAQALRGLAGWDGQQWRALVADSGYVGEVFFYASIGFSCGFDPFFMPFQRLVAGADALYIGSRLSGLDGQPSQGLIAFDGQQMRPIEHPEDTLGLSGPPFDMIADGHDGVYVSGPSHFGSKPAGPSRIARLDPQAGWRVLEQPLPDDLFCSPMVVDQAGRLVVACTSYRNDPNRSNPNLWLYSVWRLDDQGWHEWLSEDVSPRVLGMALAGDGTIWLAGGRGGAHSTPGFVARIVGDDFQMIEDDFDSLVNSLDVWSDPEDPSSTRVLVSGGFSRIGSQAHDYIALLEDGEWQALPGLEDPPDAMTLGSGQAVVSVNPERGGPLLGGWDAAEGQWQEWATEAQGFPAVSEQARFSQLAWSGDRLFAAGLSILGPSDGAALLVYEGEQFEMVGGGLTANVLGSLAITPSAIYLGGRLVETDIEGSPASSVGIARLHWD